MRAYVVSVIRLKSSVSISAIESEKNRCITFYVMRVIGDVGFAALTIFTKVGILLKSYPPRMQARPRMNLKFDSEICRVIFHLSYS